MHKHQPVDDKIPSINETVSYIYIPPHVVLSLHQSSHRKVIQTSSHMSPQSIARLTLPSFILHHLQSIPSQTLK